MRPTVPATLVGCLVLLACAALLLAQEPAPDQPRNGTCPVMVGRQVDPDIWVDHGGKRVWLCCRSCVDDFLADPERYLPLLPQFAAAPAADPRAEHPLGALHPVLVHFPVALALAALLAALLSLPLGRALRNATTFCLLLAAATAVPAFLLGEEALAALGKTSPGLTEAVEAHELWGKIGLFAVLGAAGLDLVSRFASRSALWRGLSLLGILVAASAVGYAGYLGGEVVRPGHLDFLLP